MHSSMLIRRLFPVHHSDRRVCFFYNFYLHLSFHRQYSVLNREKAMATDQHKSPYVIPNDVPIALLDCREAFERLTHEEKLYAHHLAQAAFKGSLICLFQVEFFDEILSTFLFGIVVLLYIMSILAEVPASSGISGFIVVK